MKTAFITGVTGQDGSYLSEFLLDKKYRVVGLVSKKYNIGWDNIEHLKDKLLLEDGDLLDKKSLEKIFKKYKIDEAYNLAALSFIPTCWQKPALAFDINALGVLRLLEIIKEFSPKTRFYQASTSKIFGRPKVSPQNEQTSLSPQDPYSVAKAAAHFMVQSFRKNYSLFAVNGILYNHESSRRGPDFVTRKITLGAAKIKLGLAKKLKLGNLKAKEDWGWAPDYVKAMWLMLQQKKAQDFVVGSGQPHSVAQVCQVAFSTLGMDYKKHTVRDRMFYREQKGKLMIADSRKARKKLGWKPSVSFEEMIKKMTLFDYQQLKGGLRQ